jgi:ABC-2 type transport system ATP-binding protein
MDAIEAENLHKSYDDVSVLRGLDLRVPAGQVYGLLGPNGSGKSTLIHLMLGFLRPSQGTLKLFGERDLELVRGRLGYLPERLRYHLRYTAREYLRYLGRFSDLRASELAGRVDDALEIVGLSDAAERVLAVYSKGMLQRFGIAQALLANPDMLLIDEPTSGLDPAGQREMLNLLGELARRNHTIFLATHYLDEIDQLCDTVGILYNGRLAAQIDVAALRVPGSAAVLKVAPLAPEMQAQLALLGPGVRVTAREIVLSPNTPALQAQVLRALLDAGVPIISLEPQSRPLEEMYMRVVRGETLDSAPASAPPPAPPVMREPNTPADTTIFMPPVPPAAPEPDAPAESVASPGRPRGDTLLRELLGEPKNQPDERRDG